MICGNALCDGGCLAVKTFSIGDWDMDHQASVSIAHNLSLTQIRSIEVTIRNDAGTRYYPGVGSDGVSMPLQVSYIDENNVVLSRANGKEYDDPAFHNTNYNRGWVTIIYCIKEFM